MNLNLAFLTMPQTLFLLIMSVAILLFITEALRVDVVAILIMLALALTGLIEIPEAFAGLASEPAVIVAAVFVLSAGLSATGVTDLLGDYVQRLSGSGETRAIFVIMLFVAAMSAFTHHLMVTAMMLPIIMKICKDGKKLHASRLLIPMATAASLGTTLTLIGAPAFLLANGILKRSGEPMLGLFSISKVGGPLLLTGIVFCILMRWVLPKKSGTDEVDNQFKLTDITTDLTLLDKSPWAGKTFNEFAEKTKKQFDVINWVGKNKIPKALQENTVLDVGDTFTIKTTADELVSFDGKDGLVIPYLLKYSDGTMPASLEGEDRRILKAVISPRSEFVGLTVAQIRFYRRFEVVVVGLWRKSGWISGGIADTVIQAGDMLVLWGQQERLNRLNLHHGFLMFLPFYGKTTKRSKSTIAILIMGASVMASAFGFLPSHIAFVTGALMMVLTRCLSIEQAYGSIETKIYVMIAGVIPLGLAMQKTGVDQLLADQFLKWTQGWEPILMLLAFFWIASLVTQILSDAATTVLLAPVAVAFAKGTSLVSPTSAVVCVTVGAVASFLTPIGHHGNLLILSPGGYRFADFLKIGFPLTVILSLVTCYMSLHFWTAL